MTRMRVLVAMPSTNQMYSGVGRALMELSRRMAGRVAYEFAVDDLNGRNLELLRSFADEHAMPVHVGEHECDPRFVEPRNRDLPGLLDRGDWDAIELVGFANAGTGRAVLSGIGDRVLSYTPHDQPLWTVPMSEDQQANTSQTHRDVIERADVVFADSPHERDELQRLAPGRSHVEFHPLGCSFDEFEAGTVERPLRLLFVGDLNEIRKRFDRVVAVLERLLERFPSLRLMVVGNKSDGMAGRIPRAVRSAIDLRGYVTEAELRGLYRACRGLLLFSEVEAFGLPILEAMACGTSVYLSDLPTTRSLFGAFRSAVFCDVDDLEGTVARIAVGIGGGTRPIAAAIAERAVLRERFEWDRLASRKADALAAAWWRRRRWAWSA